MNGLIIVATDCNILKSFIRLCVGERKLTKTIFALNPFIHISAVQSKYNYTFGLCRDSTGVFLLLNNMTI